MCTTKDFIFSIRVTLIDWFVSSPPPRIGTKISSELPSSLLWLPGFLTASDISRMESRRSPSAKLLRFYPFPLAANARIEALQLAFNQLLKIHFNLFPWPRWCLPFSIKKNASTWGSHSSNIFFLVLDASICDASHLGKFPFRRLYSSNTTN